jgi:hypothetical protein
MPAMPRPSSSWTLTPEFVSYLDDDKVHVSLSDEKSFTRQDSLNFVDNRLDRSSGDSCAGDRAE